MPPVTHPSQARAPQHRQQQAEPQYLRDTFTYSALFASIANGNNDTVNINIRADADFVWQKGMFQCDIAGAAVTNASRVIPLMTILMVDTGSGRQLMDQAVPLPNVFGIGELPFILPQPKTFARSSVISITLANYSNATTYTNIYVSLHGTLLFPITPGA